MIYLSDMQIALESSGVGTWSEYLKYEHGFAQILSI